MIVDSKLRHTENGFTKRVDDRVSHLKNIDTENKIMAARNNENAIARRLGKKTPETVKQERYRRAINRPYRSYDYNLVSNYSGDFYHQPMVHQFSTFNPMSPYDCYGFNPPNPMFYHSDFSYHEAFNPMFLPQNNPWYPQHSQQYSPWYVQHPRQYRPHYNEGRGQRFSSRFNPYRKYKY